MRHKNKSSENRRTGAEAGKPADTEEATSGAQIRWGMEKVNDPFSSRF
jgi:hypothetical protein